jgi:uncharacterized protein YkwD
VVYRQSLIAVAIWLLSCAAIGAAPQEALHRLRALRLAGCQGHAGTQVPIRVSAALNAAAEQWSRGTPLKSAIERTGYRQDQSAGLHVEGSAQAVADAVTQRLCVALTDPSMSDAGVLTRGEDVWIVLAAPFTVPTPAAAGGIAAEVLRLVNAARGQAQHCGRSLMPPVPALQLNPLLSDAAVLHAQDMLRFNYLDHTGHDGSSPAERVAATGYRYRIVGENLAAGPETPQEAVRGWMASPGHCQNIMDERFTELGVAFAANRSGSPRILWAQEFAAPH